MLLIVSLTVIYLLFLFTVSVAEQLKDLKLPEPVRTKGRPKGFGTTVKGGAHLSFVLFFVF
jgi:hypothetical protein